MGRDTWRRAAGESVGTVPFNGRHEFREARYFEERALSSLIQSDGQVQEQVHVVA